MNNNLNKRQSINKEKFVSYSFHIRLCANMPQERKKFQHDAINS